MIMIVNLAKPPGPGRETQAFEPGIWIAAWIGFPIQYGQPVIHV
jgi:hypothetical protein